MHRSGKQGGKFLESCWISAGALGSITLHTLLVLQASYREVGLQVNLLACISAVGQKPHICRKDLLEEGSEECRSYRFQGPRGHETHSAHNWLCKFQLKLEKEKQVKLQLRGGLFPPWLRQRLVFSSLPVALDQDRNTHTHSGRELCCDFFHSGQTALLQLLLTSCDEHWREKPFSSPIDNGTGHWNCSSCSWRGLSCKTVNKFWEYYKSQEMICFIMQTLSVLHNSICRVQKIHYSIPCVWGANRKAAGLGCRYMQSCSVHALRAQNCQFNSRSVIP